MTDIRAFAVLSTQDSFTSPLLKTLWRLAITCSRSKSPIRVEAMDSPPDANPPDRFNSHVAFETTAHTELNKGPAGITLNEKHNGFRHERRAKTFMVGVDENSYSVEALEWLLTSMVDDHDTVVCVRVIDKDIKHNMKNAYLAEAKRFMHDILQTNTSNKAISVVVEYQFGRLGQTFENLVCLLRSSRSLLVLFVFHF